MSGHLIILTGFLYLWTCIDLYFQNKLGLSIAYFGYALANIGLYIVAK